MSKDMVIFDDGTVVIVSHNKKKIYAKGSNTNGQLPASFRANQGGFVEVGQSFIEGIEDKILGIYAGGSKDSRDSALFILVSKKTGVKAIISTKSKRTRLTPEAILYVCGRNLRPYFSIPLDGQSATDFFEIPLPQVDITRTTETGQSVNLPVINLGVYRNNIVLVARLRDKFVPLWANANAIAAYDLLNSHGIRSRLSSIGEAAVAVDTNLFQPVEFPLEGDSAGRSISFGLIPEDDEYIKAGVTLAERNKRRREVRKKLSAASKIRTPEKCLATANYMIVMTKSGKCYFKGENCKRVDYHSVPAIEPTFLRPTKTGAFTRTSWCTLEYTKAGQSDTTITDAYINNDGTPYVLTRFGDHINLSLKIAVTVPKQGSAIAFAIANDNLLAVTITGSLIGGGERIRGFSGKNYNASTSLQITFDIGVLELAFKQRCLSQYTIGLLKASEAEKLSVTTEVVTNIGLSRQGAYLYTNKGNMLGFGYDTGLMRGGAQLIWRDPDVRSVESQAEGDEEEDSICWSDDDEGEYTPVGGHETASGRASPTPPPLLGMPNVDLAGGSSPPPPRSYAAGHLVPPGMDPIAWQQGRMSPAKP